MAKVSVIIPAYNAEKTLAACLGNLVHQTLSDIEIIIVNDCSKDSTLQIMLDCEAQFPDKIIVVNSDTNHGAGGARNIGLSYASGEYIGFVDSDDIVTPDMYEKLYNKAIEGDYDIVDCGYYNETEDTAIVHTSDELTGILNPHKRMELIASGGYLWSRIFRKSFWDSLNITFREHCILEDCETLMLAFAKAKSIGNVKEILYCYKKNEASISKCVNATSYFKNATEAVDAIVNTLGSIEEYSDIKEAVEYSISNLCVLSANVCMTHGAKDPAVIQKARLEKLRDYLKKHISIPFAKNQYIQNKISKADQKTLQDLLNFR